MKRLDVKYNEFKNWYDETLSYHQASVDFFCTLFSSIPFVESVKGRVKEYDECLSRFNRKYLPHLKSMDHDFVISNYISDLIGIRVVCFYSDEIYQIRRHLRKFFKEIEITDKTGSLEKTDDKFGYRSLHLQLVLKGNLKEIPDAEKFLKIKMELQIRTVIQDAWSVLDHKIKYKKSIPLSLKRRINRLSALFEIADDEFLNVKTEIENEEQKISQRLKKGGKIERNKTLDVFRFLFITLKYFPDYYFIEFKVDGFVQEILQLKSNFTEGELNEALQFHLDYANEIELNSGQKLNPYTKIRYCLNRYDSSSFRKMLSNYQQSNI